MFKAKLIDGYKRVLRVFWGYGVVASFGVEDECSFGVFFTFG
jgi:hypothetical protein